MELYGLPLRHPPFPQCPSLSHRLKICLNFSSGGSLTRSHSFPAKRTPVGGVSGVRGRRSGVSSADRITLPPGQGSGQELQAVGRLGSSHVRDDHRFSLLALQIARRGEGKAACTGRLFRSQPYAGTRTSGRSGAAFEGRYRSEHRPQANRCGLSYRACNYVRSGSSGVAFAAIVELVPAYAADVLNSLEKDVFPYIGSTPVAVVTSPIMLQLVRRIEDRPSVETARRVRQRIAAVYGFAIASGYAPSDPAVSIRGAMKPLIKKR